MFEMTTPPQSFIKRRITVCVYVYLFARLIVVLVVWQQFDCRIIRHDVLIVLRLGPLKVTQSIVL